jgi:hypothetical protein
MSIFKTKWILLKKNINHKNIIYTIFTEDYWKITVFSKEKTQKKRIDLWYILSFEIKNSNNKNILYIQNIKIIKEFNYLNLNFETINFYQILLTLIHKLLPEKKQIFNIVEIIEKINIISNNEKISWTKIFEKIIFACLKIINILGLLNIENKNPEIKKILNFIDKNNFYTILKLSWLKEKNKKIIEKIIISYIKN